MAEFLCAGCNVREPFEHRCHGANCSCDMCEAPCTCVECEEERFASLPDMEASWALRDTTR